MDFFIAAIAFIVIFSVLVLIHEWGHFYAARKAGVAVEEFGFGLPPRILGKKVGDTLYSVNWIPFGGFVKLLGENAHDPKLLKNKKSFVAKKPLVRLLIVTAGVLMNFVLAIVLLTIGFTFGIQPLIISTDDVFANLENGNIQTVQGILVKDVKEGGVAHNAGLRANDRIISVNGEDVVDPQQIDLGGVGHAQADYIYSVERGGNEISLHMEARSGESLGFDLYQIFFVPHPVVLQVLEGSVPDVAGLKKGDTINVVNGKPVYYLDDVVLDGVVGAGAGDDFVVQRGEKMVQIHAGGEKAKDAGTVSGGMEPGFADSDFVVIDQIYSDMPAQKAGLVNGDIMVEVNGEPVRSAEQFVALTKANAGKDTLFKIRRGDRILEFTIRPTDKGLIGVGLPKVRVFADGALALYASATPVSVLKIKDVQYPFWVAPFKALEETGRLSLVTLTMFGDVVSSIVTKFTVPEGVAGP
ncbi:site-2 protease family protein, partial [Patescibacteria group bacterium]|nr:site-2 protease family protein [Patescibacteria group bacterium]MBU1703597.1 site-2 protease family protein [Patescibacteria group bacterium]MBU1953572.1 site-2 protease family protein [Patescibacteria group bacterium]